MSFLTSQVHSTMWGTAQQRSQNLLVLAHSLKCLIYEYSTYYCAMNTLLLKSHKITGLFFRPVFTRNFSKNCLMKIASVYVQGQNPEDDRSRREYFYYVNHQGMVDIKTEAESQMHLSYAHAGNELIVPFEPEKLCMTIEAGRVYHPAPEKVGGVGLIRSKLAIQLSPLFIFDNGEDKPPTRFKWKTHNCELTQEMFSCLERLREVRKFSLGIDITK